MKKKVEDKYKLHDVGDVIDDVVKLIRKTHDIKQKVKWYNDYRGEDIYKPMDVIPLKEKINEDSWEFNNHGNGSDRPMIEMIIESVFSIGYQQGERRVRRDYDQIMDINKALIGVLQKNPLPSIPLPQREKGELNADWEKAISTWGQEEHKITTGYIQTVPDSQWVTELQQIVMQLETIKWVMGAQKSGKRVRRTTTVEQDIKELITAINNSISKGYVMVQKSTEDGKE